MRNRVKYRGVNGETIQDVRKLYDEFVDSIEANEQLDGKRVVFNGLFFDGFDADAFIELVESCGMKVTWNVTNSTDYYVVNFDNAHYSKLNSALREKQYGASFKVIPFESFFNLINSHIIEKQDQNSTKERCDNDDSNVRLRSSITGAGQKAHINNNDSRSEEKQSENTIEINEDNASQNHVEILGEREDNISFESPDLSFGGEKQSEEMKQSLLEPLVDSSGSDTIIE